MAISSTARRALAERDRLRALVCVPPRYPGSPNEYSYVVTESCRKRAPPRKSAAALPSSSPKALGNASAKASKASVKARATVGSKQQRSELAVLERALADYPKDYMEDSIAGDLQQVVTHALAYMLDPKVRADRPDPLKRYADFVSAYHSTFLKVNRKQPAELPRHTVLSIVAAALRASSS